METSIPERFKEGNIMLNTIVNHVLDAIESNVGLFGSISLDTLPESNGLYCEITAGYNSQEYLNRMNNKIIPLLFLCKNDNQSICIDSLSQICDYIEKVKKYPQITEFQWINSTVATTPNKIGKDERYYIYSCIINIEVYY